MTDQSNNDPRSRAAAAARARLGHDIEAEEEKTATTSSPDPAPTVAAATVTAPTVTAPTVTAPTVGASRRRSEATIEGPAQVVTEVDAGAPARSRRRARGARPDRGPRSWKRVSVGLALLSVALVAGLATSLVTLADRGNRVNDLNVALASDRSESTGYESSQSALVAAKTYAVELSSYNYTQLSQDFAVVLAHSTPTFKANYTKSSAGLDKVLAQYKASASGSVLAAGVSSASATQAVVLVFVNQKVTNSTQTKGATTDESRIEMTLDRTGGKWLIDKVQLL